MCLAVPMRLLEILPDGTGTVEMDSARSRIDLSLVPGAEEGDYVIVHAGFAIEKLDCGEADERIALFEALAESHRETATDR